MCTHPVDPPPVQMCLGGTTHEGPQGDSYDGCHAEDRHRKTPVFVASPYVCDCSSNDVDTNGTRTATEKASYDQCGEVWRGCGRNEPDLIKQSKSVEWRRGMDSSSLHLRGTRYKHQSSQAYDPCSPSKARRAVGRPQRLCSMKQ